MVLLVEHHQHKAQNPQARNDRGDPRSKRPVERPVLGISLAQGLRLATMLNGRYHQCANAEANQHQRHAPRSQERFSRRLVLAQVLKELVDRESEGNERG